MQRQIEAIKQQLSAHPPYDEPSQSPMTSQKTKSVSDMEIDQPQEGNRFSVFTFSNIRLGPGYYI